MASLLQGSPDPQQSFGLWQLIIGAGAVVVGAFTGLFGSWRAVTKEKVDINMMKADIDKAIDSAGDTIRNEFGETVAAAIEKVRQVENKLHEVEKWNRDTFVSKRSFDIVTSEMKEVMRRLETKIDGGFSRLDEKLDALRS